MLRGNEIHHGKPRRAHAGPDAGVHGRQPGRGIPFGRASGGLPLHRGRSPGYRRLSKGRRGIVRRFLTKVTGLGHLPAGPAFPGATPPPMWLCWRRSMPLTKTCPAPRCGTFCSASSSLRQDRLSTAGGDFGFPSLQPAAFGAPPKPARRRAPYAGTPRLNCRTAQARSTRPA